MISRRSLLASLAAVAATPAWARKWPDLGSAALAAALYAFPIGEMARLAAASPARNRFGHRRTLSDHTHRGVTMPNNDTLYSSCWLDLEGGAHADVDLPVGAGRYVSAAVMGMDSDVIAVESASGHALGPARLRIVGPEWDGSGDDGRRLVRLPGHDGWLLVRIGVSGLEDLAAAQAVQQQIWLAVSGAREGRSPFATEREQAPGLRTLVNKVLARTSPRAPLRRRARHHRHFGIDAEAPLSAAHEAAWLEAAARLTPETIGDITRYGTIINGWHWPHRNIARFGSDERFRAAVALSGIGALPEREAIYLTAMHDSAGKPLVPGKAYRIDLHDPPPVEAFWSLSAYRAEADGRFFFLDNPLRRYAVGSATDGLRSGGVVVASAQPPKGEDQVWLPISDGPFRLVLRAYRPRAAMLSRKWRPPAIVPLG